METTLAGTFSQEEAHTIPFSVQLSAQWLLDRTYHAQLLDGRELSSVNLTRALQQLTDIAVPLSSQSSISHLPEHLPLQKSRSFSIPISTWQETTQAEARTTYQQGKPILLYSERSWEHTHATPGIWRPNQNMRAIIDGNTLSRPDATSGTSTRPATSMPNRASSLPTRGKHGSLRTRPSSSLNPIRLSRSCDPMYNFPLRRITRSSLQTGKSLNIQTTAGL